MKTLSLIGLLLFTIACKVDKKKESCTINGEKRPMDDCRAKEVNEQRSRQALKASITVAINLETTGSSGTLTVLENNEDIKHGNNDQECGIRSQAGQVTKISKVGLMLRLVDEHNKTYYMQPKGQTKGFIGTWTRDIRDAQGSGVYTLIIHSPESMTLSMQCN